jgi:hypothetical protein
MDEPFSAERRRTERRWRERRFADHPVFLDTRLPYDRRAGDRRHQLAEAAGENKEKGENDPALHRKD